MKILRSSVFLHYLDQYHNTRAVCEDLQKVYDGRLRTYKELLNVKDNWSRNSYWVDRENEFYSNRKIKYGTTEEQKHLRKDLAEQLTLRKRNLKHVQKMLYKSYENLQKAIKIQTGISNYNAYDLLDTDEIEKMDIQSLANLTKYPPEYANIAGFNPTVIKEQHEAMLDGVAYKK